MQVDQVRSHTLPGGMQSHKATMKMGSFKNQSKHLPTENALRDSMK